MKAALTLGLMIGVMAHSSARGDELDLGDRTSATITSKAWKALTDKKYPDAVSYAKKCVEMYEKQAIEMQKGLKDPVPSDNREAVAKNWALNDVGTCLFIMGQALEKQDKGKEAIMAYKQLIEKVAFSQCWDPKGWYWKPATAAKDRIKALEFDSDK